jgi:hypothetical protein
VRRAQRQLDEKRPVSVRFDEALGVVEEGLL